MGPRDKEGGEEEENVLKETLDEIAREEARRLIVEALKVEVAKYI